jgi:two-component system CitB family response regulator
VVAPTPAGRRARVKILRRSGGAARYYDKSVPGIGCVPSSRPLPSRIVMAETNASFRILVIDDEPFSRHVATTLLGSLGAGQIVSAASSAEAKAALVADPSLGLILSDHYMPDGSGLRLLGDLRQGRLPIPHDSYFIVATASRSYALTSVALALDADSFISKPFGKEDLARRLYEFMVLGSRSIHPPLHYRDLDVNGMIAAAERMDPAAPVTSADSSVPMVGLNRVLPDTPLGADLQVGKRAGEGSVLLRAGTPLSRHLISRLLELGITEVPVRITPLDNAAALRRAAIAKKNGDKSGP